MSVWDPAQSHASVPKLPCVPNESVNQEHNENEVRVKVLIGVHELVDRKEWIQNPDALAEAKKEAQGLIDAGTWDFNNVVSRGELKRKVRESGRALPLDMTITRAGRTQNPRPKEN